MSGACPTSPFPAKIVMRSNPRVLTNSTMSGKKFSRAFGVHLWDIEATYPPMTRADFDSIYAFAISQGGSYGTFTFAAHDRRTPRGIATGTPVIRNRQNLLKYSEQIDNANWAKSHVSITADATNAPDGNHTADQFIEDATTNIHNIDQTVTGLDTTQNFTFAVRIKPNGRTKVGLFCGNGSNYFYITCDISTYAVNAFGQNGTATKTSYSVGPDPNDATWTLVWVSGKANQGTTSLDCQIRTLDSSYTQSYLGDGTSGIYLSQAALEKHSKIGPYISTTSAAVNTESQSGNTPYTGGWTASQTGILKAGDLVLFNSGTKVYMQTEDVDSDASGVAQLTLSSDLIATPVDGETVTVSNVPFTVGLSQDIEEIFTDQANIYQYVMKMTEAL